MEQHLRALHASVAGASRSNRIRWMHVWPRPKVPEEPGSIRIDIKITGPQRREFEVPPEIRPLDKKPVEMMGRHWGWTFRITATPEATAAIGKLTAEGLLERHPADVEMEKALKRIAQAKGRGKPLSQDRIMQMVRTVIDKIREDG